MELLEMPCPECGNPTLPADAFCAACGASVSDEPIKPWTTWTLPPREIELAAPTRPEPDPVDPFIPLRVEFDHHDTTHPVISRVSHAWRQIRVRALS